MSRFLLGLLILVGAWPAWPGAVRDTGEPPAGLTADDWSQIRSVIESGLSETKLVGHGDPLPQALGRFGRSLAVSGDTVVVGVPAAFQDEGSAYVFVRSGSVWTLQQKLTASDPEATAEFGASVSADADTIVVGAPRFGEPYPGGSNEGAAYVFVRSGTAWSEQRKLLPSQGFTSGFGQSVSVSGDTLAVTAVFDNCSGCGLRFAGRTYVFVRSGTSWAEQQRIPGDTFSGGRQVSVLGDTLVVGALTAPSLSVPGAAEVLVRSGTAWTHQQWLSASDGTAGNGFGSAVSLSGETVVIGAPYQDTPAGADAGSAYVFVRAGAVWTEQQKLTASDAVADDRFGASVALAGDTGVVGADHADAASAADGGSAYVFGRVATSWTERQKLTASDGGPGDVFGSSVGVSGDTVVVGAPGHDHLGAADAGAAYVFAGSGSVWSEQQKLTGGPDRPVGDAFGGSVSVSGDTVVVGARYDNTAGGANTGSAYVFVRSGAAWAEQQKLTAIQASPGASFGASVSLSGDTVVVGAPNDVAPGGDRSGAAYVFVRSGTAWAQQQRLTASDGRAYDGFGLSVAVSGETLVVGAPYADSPTRDYAGSSYVFVRTGTVWTEQQKLTTPELEASDRFFGFSVSVSGDTVLVGADGSGPRAGAAYVYVRSGTMWAQQQKLTASDGAADDRFGAAVSLSGDTAMVGAPEDDTPAGEDTGSAYVFVRSGTTWSQWQKLTAADAGPYAWFGSSVSIFGDKAVVGASRAGNGGGQDTGAAYLYVRAGTTWIQAQKVVASDGADEDRFGAAVGIVEGTVVAGAGSASTADGFSTGSAYVWDLPAVDLSVTLTDSPDPVVGLQPLAYTIVVSNAGPAPVEGVSVSQSLPAGTALQSAAGPGWTCGTYGGEVTCTRPSLAPGPAPDILVTVTAPPIAQTISSTARVAFIGVDSTPSDNSDTETTAVTDAPRADLSVSKSDGGAAAEWGQPLTWTITVSNQGPEPVTGASVVDPFPPGVAFVTWTCVASSGSSCPASGSGNISALVDLALGGTVAFTASGAVQPGATTVMNTVTVSTPATIYDPNSPNNRSTTVTPPSPSRYYAVVPCRVVDTRETDTPLAANSTRVFTLAGSCGIPADARTVAVNLVAVNPGQGGNLRVFPAGQPVPLASVLNFVTGRTRANNAIVALGTAGQASVRCDMPPGSDASTHFVLDVVGYFR